MTIRRLDPRRFLALAIAALALAVSGAAPQTMHAHASDRGQAAAGHALTAPGTEAPCHDGGAEEIEDHGDGCGEACDGCACTACFASTGSLPADIAAPVKRAARAHNRAGADYAGLARDVPRSPPKRLS